MKKQSHNTKTDFKCSPIDNTCSQHQWYTNGATNGATNGEPMVCITFTNGKKNKIMFGILK